VNDLVMARAAIVAAGVRLGSRGLVVASEGNLSIRLGDTVLITPSGRRKDELAAEDIVEVPLDGSGATPAGHPHGLRPSSDVAIHRAIYLARPDVAAIAHAHLAASLALTIVRQVPDPADLPETALLLPRLPYVLFAEMGSAVLAAAVAAALTDRGPAGGAPMAEAVLLERHGAIAVGPDLVLAGDRLELVDLLCRVRRDVLLLRAALPDHSGG
jgi:ribulose-5-phosphate 4-epimerase/fuculose-1-phosphate aldolase